MRIKTITIFAIALLCGMIAAWMTYRIAAPPAGVSHHPSSTSDPWTPVGF